MVVISIEDLSEQALQGVIDAFVLREGTDYGHRDISLQEKRARVRRLILEKPDRVGRGTCKRQRRKDTP